MAKISKIGLSPKLILEGSESWTRSAARQRASSELFKLTDCLLPNYNLRIDIWGPVIAAVLNKDWSVVLTA